MQVLVWFLSFCASPRLEFRILIGIRVGEAIGLGLMKCFEWSSGVCYCYFCCRVCVEISSVSGLQ